MAMDLASTAIAIAGGLLGGAGGAGGLWTYLQTRTKARGELDAATAKASIEAPADMLDAMAAFQSALNEQAKALTADLRRELEVQARKIERLENENAKCREEGDRLRGDLNQEVQLRQSLESLLRIHGVPIPARELPNAFVTIESGRVTVLKPEG